METLLNKIKMLLTEIKKSIEFYEDQILKNDESINTYKQYLVRSGKRRLHRLQGKEEAYRAVIMLINQSIIKARRTKQYK